MSAATELLGEHIRQHLSASAVGDVQVDVDPDDTLRARFATPRWCTSFRAMLTARVATEIAGSEHTRLERIADPVGRGDGRLQSIVIAVPADDTGITPLVVGCKNCGSEYELTAGGTNECPACGVVAWRTVESEGDRDRMLDR